MSSGNSQPNSPEKSSFLQSVLGTSAESNNSVKPTTKDAAKKQDSSLTEKIASNLADKLVSEAKSTVSNSVSAAHDKVTNTIATNKIVSNSIKEVTPKPLLKSKINNDHFPAGLTLAVVGHTNTGKTSLLRTLLRDSGFGEIKNASATTKHVERISIFDGETPLVDLYDTPGLEDAGGLLDWLEDNTHSRADGVERLHTFLADKIADTDFNQEAKVIRQLLASDVALYVIDSREPVLGKYKDELTVLSWCAKPVMPVFNFIHEVSNDNLSSWQDMLSRRNLHVSASFDTVAFDFDGEMNLWQNLHTLLSNTAISKPKLTDTLLRLQDIRTTEWHHLEETAYVDIAHTLIDIASFKKEINEDDDPVPVLAEMQEKVRQLERRLHDRMLSIYRFYDSDIAPTDLSLENFQRDPFDPELLKAYGIRTTSGAVAGALAGLGIDAATFGASLGLGAAIGGIIGGVLSNTQSISDRITGVQSLYIDPETITLIATRSTNLLTALMQRGHASQTVIELKNIDHHADGENENNENTLLALWDTNKLPKILKKARSKEAWSELNTQDPEQSFTLRDEEAREFAMEMMRDK